MTKNTVCCQDKHRNHVTYRRLQRHCYNNVKVQFVTLINVSEWNESCCTCRMLPSTFPRLTLITHAQNRIWGLCERTKLCLWFSTSSSTAFLSTLLIYHLALIVSNISSLVGRTCHRPMPGRFMNILEFQLNENYSALLQTLSKSSRQIKHSKH